MLRLGGEPHKRRHGLVDGPLDLGNGGAEGGAAAEGSQARLRPAGVCLEGGMSAVAADDRADDGALVGPLREAGKDLADLDPGDIRRDRLELPPNFARGVGLEIPEILMGRPTAEKDVDDRLVGQL